MSTKNAQKEIRIFQPLDREKLKRFCSNKSINALESSLSALEHGRAVTPSFPLYGSTDISVVKRFLDLHVLKNSSVPQWMKDYELSRLEKFGPQGGHAPWKELKEGFELYFTRPTACNASREVVESLKRKYKKFMHPLMLSTAEVLPKLIREGKILTRAAGWSTFDLKKSDKEAQRQAVTLARNGDWKHGYAYVFSRFNKQKKRIFMPMPFSSMIVQAQYYQPFLSAIQQSLLTEKSNSPFLFWADKVGLNNDKMLEILQERVSKYPLDNDEVYLFVQRDFEKMDTTMGSAQYEATVIPLMAAAFGLKENSNAYSNLVEVMKFTTTCPIITPDGVTTLDHGTASGAEVTNGGETLGNEAYDEEVSQKTLAECESMGIRVVIVYSVGNGDDGGSLFKLRKRDVPRFKDVYTKMANLVADQHGYRVQASKWLISEYYGLYCQYMLWIEQGVLHQAYPAVLALNAIINPEKQYTKADWDKDYRDLDIITKLDTCHGSLYFHALVDYVDKGMRFRLLGRTETETKRILSKYDKWRSLQDPSEMFNKTLGDIHSSPTVKYLLSKR
nr:RNA-dependent RNA polymerase [Picobirnavirus sp.]